MRLYNKKYYLTSGFLAFLISFILLFVGVRAVLGHEIRTENIAAFLCFSFLIGIITSCLAFFKLKFTIIAFLAGLFIGFIMMYQGFLNKASGWGDLAGIVSLITWIFFGLIAGLIIQAIYSLYHRFKKTNKKRKK